MLAALLLLGILPFAALPAMAPSEESSSDDPEMCEDEAENTAGLVKCLLTDDGDEEGAVYHVQSGETLTELSAFKPGEDIVEVDLTRVEGEIVFDMAESENGTWVSFGVSDDMTTTVEFSGLADIPFSDIMLKLTDETNGEIYEQSLADTFAMGTTGPDGALAAERVDREQPLDPSDLSEIFNAADEGDAAASTDDAISVDPAISDIFAATLPQPEVIPDPEVAEPQEPPAPQVTAPKSEPLIAIDDSDDPSAGEESPVITVEDDGSSEGLVDDIIAQLAGTDQGVDGEQLDPVRPEGGAFCGFDDVNMIKDDEKADVYWLFKDGSDHDSVADVADFEVGYDFLRVSLNPEFGESDEPIVLVEPSEDGADSIVKINGDLVAILRGAPTATTSDILAEIQPDVFS